MLYKLLQRMARPLTLTFTASTTRIPFAPLNPPMHQQVRSHTGLHTVLEQVEQMLPSLHGQITAYAKQQTTLAAELYAYWQAAEAAAGKNYWRARSWSMLIWQPAYLLVLAAHQAQVAIPLSEFEQQAVDGVTCGFRLPEQTLQQTDLPSAIRLAATNLREFHQQQWQSLNQIQPFSAKAAACTTVDCVLSALLLLNKTQHSSPHTLSEHAHLWLTALQWQQHGTLMRIQLDEARNEAVLARQGCCQHFRLAGQQPCSNCPRLSQSERIHRMRQEIQ